jgi:hypothetical protein
MRRRFCVAILLGLVLLAGCARPRPIRFIGILSRANGRISTAAKAFTKTLTPLSQGLPANTSEVDSTYRDLGTAIQEATKEIREVGSPLGSKQGAELLNAYRDYLSDQQSIYDKQVRKMYDAALGIGTPAEKWANIAQLLQEMDAAEASSYSAVDAAQSAYAKRHGLRLE